jgi:ribosome-associated protein
MGIPMSEIAFSAIRAQGAGGQNVNKVSSAVQLRFDISASQALPDEAKRRLLALGDSRISSNGVVIIKSQRFRSQSMNKDDALDRLRTLIQRALAVPKPRKKTRRPAAAERRRLDDKSRRGRLKQSRSRAFDD